MIKLQFALAYLAVLSSSSFAQRTDWPSTDMPPLVLRDTRPDEWPDLRSRIETRLKLYLGERPPEALNHETKFEETGRDQIAGLTRIRYRYQVIDDYWNDAFLILPPDLKEGERRPVVVVIHGTIDLGKEATVTESGTGRRAYATELARRGYITFSPDLFGYGKPHDSSNRHGMYFEFDKKYPKWSQADRTVFGLQCGLDLLDKLPMVRTGEYGAMGNSLGGGQSLRLMAADQRIKVTIASTGTSPQATNIYRLVGKEKGAREGFDAIVKKTGRTPYEITDMLALCAPRALMVLEPFDDPYNPDVGATFSAVRNAWMVWSLLGAPKKASILIHGDGHDTVDEVRETAYGWIERWLPVNPAAPAAALNELTTEEKAQGWRLLFDGKTTTGWRGYHSQEMPPKWEIIDGALTLTKSSPVGAPGAEGTGLVTVDEFTDFDLRWEWKLAPGGNSGVIYRVSEELAKPHETGIEYQLADAKLHPDGMKTSLKWSSACYGMYAPPRDLAKPSGEWNSARILVRGKMVEHWLNGELAAKFEIGGEDWQARIVKSKFTSYPRYGLETKGRICFQDHSHTVAFRNVKILPL